MALISCAVFLLGCSGFKSVDREFTTPPTLQRLPQDQLEKLRESSPFLKVHMQSGNTYVLHTWDTDEARSHVSGEGVLYNTMRDTLQQGWFQVGVDSVAIFETNILNTPGSVAALTVFTGITVGVAILCAINPKTCFGSCPTFYVPHGDSLRLQAEGFSASIAPSLVATDVDDLSRVAKAGTDFEIEMRNEAMETHVVSHVDLLAVPHKRGHVVVADGDGRFWESGSLMPPASATGPEGDCQPALSRLDGNERYSRSDSTYLGEKEIIEITFDDIPPQSSGLVIGCRQTLLSTYLLYQSMAYMGNEAGYWLAEIERGNVKQTQNSLEEIVGGIDVLMRGPLGDWEVVGRVDEHGPLATDVHLLSLGTLGGESARIRLRMTKGNWRIDYVALGAVLKPVQATRVRPREVLKDGTVVDEARAVLHDPLQALTTLPGDTYTLRYGLPVTPGDYALFVESRGYYLEWIRKEWIKEENPLLLAEMIFAPHAALTRLAPEFKRVEADMEEYFWGSRYAKP
jgi:hypothetical protein